MVKTAYRVSVKVDGEDGVFRGHWLKWSNVNAQGEFKGAYFKTLEDARRSVLQSKTQYASDIIAYQIEKLTFEEVETRTRTKGGEWK